MKLPRDLSGHDLIKMLRRYGYEPTRQIGSHIRLRSTLRDQPHYLTVPAHSELRPGTLNAILSDVADYLGIERSTVVDQLLGK